MSLVNSRSHMKVRPNLLEFKNSVTNFYLNKFFDYEPNNTDQGYPGQHSKQLHYFS